MKPTDLRPPYLSAFRAHWQRAFSLLIYFLLGILTPARADLPSSTLISCSPPGISKEATTRGFYIEHYPGETLDAVTVYLSTATASAPLNYTVGLVITLDSFSGTPVASPTSSVSIGTVETAVPLAVGNVAIPVGRTVCFRFTVSGPASPGLVFSVPTLGVGYPCPNVIETTDTAAPLSTIRGNGVKLSITGRRHLDVTAGQSIQLAVNSASVGDTVTVAAGTYTENLHMRSGISVKGAGSGSVELQVSEQNGVVMDGCVNTEFSGFTLTQASGALVKSGITVTGGSPLVKNNIIKGFYEQGIRLISATAVICGNQISSNGHVGGTTGYGILCENGASLLMNNLLTKNQTGCLISGHASDGASFVNNTVVQNLGDGLDCLSANPSVRNNIITGNVWGVFVADGAATPSLTYNDVVSNSNSNYKSKTTGVITIGSGSISADPQFDPADADRYRLLATSPCINAGNPDAVDNDLDGSRNDMGWLGGPCASPAGSAAPFGGFLFTSVGIIPANYIGTDGLANVPPLAASALQIPAWKNAPFAAQPWLYGVFGSGVNPYAYSVEYKLHSDLDPNHYVPLNHPLSKVKFTISGGTVNASLESVGPTILGGVPTYLNTNNGGNIYWAQDTLRLVLNTLTLPDGVYDFHLTARDIFGAPFPLTNSPIPLTNAAHKLTLWINNQPPQVEIHTIAKDGAPTFLDCAVAGLALPNTNLNFNITASHPNGFLHSYALTAGYGRNQSAGTIKSEVYDPTYAGAVAWYGVTTTPFDSLSAMNAGALAPWRTCAYSFNLGAWSRATNGYGLVYYRNFSWSLALNLGGADLDGDGDVDGDDLNIMAASFGNSSH